MGSVHRLVGALLLLALTGSAAWAQDGQLSSLVGTVLDASGGVMPAVTLTAHSPDMIGGPVVTTTDDRGQYRFTALLPGVYALSVDHTGFVPWRRTAIALRPGLGVVADVRLGLAGIEQVATVSAAATIADARTSAAPTFIPREWLENLPLGTRSFQNLVNLAPGVSDRVALGGSAGAIAASLDGTAVSQPDMGGPDAQPSVFWLESAQVVSLGANAQYGEYTGAVFNAVTRSGSNAWSGLVNAWLSRNQWAGNNRRSLDQNTALQFQPREMLQHWDVSPQLGGPLRRDRLWFFAGFERYVNQQRPAAFALAPRRPGEPAESAVDTKQFLKLTAAVVPALRLEGFLEAEQGKVENIGAGPLTTPEVLGQYTYPRQVANVRLTWSRSPRTLVESRYGFYRSHTSQGPMPPNSKAGPPPRYDGFLGTYSGNYEFFDDAIRDRHLAAATLTRYASRGAATHELKAGVEYERASLRAEWGFPGGVFYEDYDGAPDLATYRDVSRRRGVQHRTSLFAQDTWQLGRRLTIEPGLRFGVYHGAVPADGVPAYDTTALSPRLGVAWDLTADRRTVARAHYGRYHDAVFTNLYDLQDPGANPETIVAQAIGQNQYQEITRFGGSAVRITIDSDIRQQYAEEYLAGLDRDLGGGVRLRAQYVRRNFKRAVGYIDTGTVWVPATVTDPGPDGRVGTADDQGPLTLFYDSGVAPASLVLANPPDARRHYEALQLVATARANARWSAEASYTWSRSRGTFDNESLSNAAGSDLGQFGNFTIPSRTLYTGRVSTGDRPHDAKVVGTYTPCCGIRVSGVYRYLSGRPWSREINVSPLTRQTSVAVEPAGTRRTDATSEADVRVEKMFGLGSTTRVGAYLDLFNVTNRGGALSVERRSGARFGVPRTWRAPRTVQLGVRLTF
ncbi:MAG: carboxypeptidase regulatory-like domain-containing protein [Vicinamibacterales bacterium]